ncbi:MAG: beta-lactamase [Acidobacteriales bacterium]|nr:beta-lactamase [Terriglobales bacterium]
MLLPILRRSVAACVVVIVMCGVGWSQQPAALTASAKAKASSASASAPDIARMEQIIQADVAAKTFMGSVLVARGNDVLLSKGYGSAVLEWNVPNSSTTKFRLGSLTKQFTAASVLLLEERGKLSVNDPIKKYLTDLPATYDNVTIHHLLSHTAGVPNFTALPDYEATKTVAQTPAQLIARFKDKPLDFPVGDRFSYSNSGYIVLGALIEKVSGMPYAQFLQENIFTPLGMKDTGYDVATVVTANRATGYVPGAKGLSNAPYLDMSIPFSAGGLYSTTEDLLKWEQGLMTGKLLSPASFTKMTTPVKREYGYGLIISTTKDGHKMISHHGGIDGFNTFLAYYPEEKLTVVVLGNVNGTAPQVIGSRLGALARGETVVLQGEHKQVAVPAKVLADYVGKYRAAPTFAIDITQDGEKLISQATNQGKLQIFPESESKFFYKVVDAQLEFFRDPSGKVTHLILYQNGRELKAVRE